LRLHVLNQEQTARHNDVAIVALQAIELFALGQGGNTVRKWLNA
jgi:hypothetical protein